MVASGIIILPLRSPVLLAKELASVDVVSHDRLIVGVRGGHIRAEFQALGVPLAGRQEHTDKYIHALLALVDHGRTRAVTMANGWYGFSRERAVGPGGRLPVPGSRRRPAGAATTARRRTRRSTADRIIRNIDQAAKKLLHL
jgi:alkanesulfonate monooxygenase SsuD/methylene tetrahydromethanopterin reductase-like flavin-dependent oxidoreductase (luciferase family)